jgi:hypothetical protein
MTTTNPVTQLRNLVTRMMRTSVLFSSNEQGVTAIPWIQERGECPLYLVLGSNAAGKSLFRRAVCSWAKRELDYQLVHTSMERRTGSGTVTPGWMRSMMYGDEVRQSTGENSAKTLAGAFGTSRSRDQDGTKHLLVLDEPAIGMSEEAQAGVGLDIREFIEDRPPLLGGLFITSHSRALISQLASLKPHYIHLGDPNGPAGLDAWLSREIVPIRPAQVREASKTRYGLVHDALHG